MKVIKMFKTPFHRWIQLCQIQTIALTLNWVIQLITKYIRSKNNLFIAKNETKLSAFGRKKKEKRNFNIFF